jgi:transcriptional regulator with XRE-family HTH domain
MAGFPERLRALRLQLGLTQEQLGEELHVSKASISAWENGREAPSFRLLPKLRAVLGVSLDELLCPQEARGSAASAHEIAARNDAEARLLKGYRRLSRKRQTALIDLLD